MALNIGFLWPQTAAEWPGGTIYAENLLKSVALANPDQEITIVLPEGGIAPKMLTDVPTLKVRSVSYRPVSRNMPPAELAAAFANRKLGRGDRSLASAVRGAYVDVMFGNLIAQVSFPVPWVGWIPDFQYLRYPEYFGPEEIPQLTRDYADLCERAAIVLLSSQNALTDMRDIYPQFLSKARVLPFVSVMDEQLFEPDPQTVVDRFGIRRPFVVVPNQWWRHKNHETAIRAAALLRDAGLECQWVLTGGTNDYRNPNYPSHILQLISELGLRDVVVPLGFLSRSDQIQLMRTADSIVQPSLFEGWSTVVEDAKTLGQRLVVSDLAIHREQDPAASLFFDPASSEDLADKVRAMLGGARERVPEAAARGSSQERACLVGKTFLEICSEAAGKWR